MGIKKQPPKISKEKLYDMYIIQEFSTKDIVKETGYSEYLIRQWLDVYEIPRRNLQESKLTNHYLEKVSGDNCYIRKEHRESYWKGKHLSSEAKRKISKARKGIYAGEFHPRYGAKVSQETKDKISKGNKEYWSTNTHGRLGKTFTKESREKNSLSKTKWFEGNTEKCHGIKGHYFSDKNNKSLRYRSKYELEVYKILEEDITVINYIAEPFRIPYEYQGITHNYIPDVLVKYTNNKVLLVEVKSKFYMNVDKTRNEAKFKATEIYCKNKNIEFQIWNEDIIFKMR